ncbi:MAG: stage V sporulation protein AC [Halanaerobiales bacterium]|nr:stage V sporulation protein AC [Bacillota bacterium]HOA40318.1 stage V sporulation protein AC [Halanaerobiales bacterium]HPZ62314.1 stage V sporulation protein AC [Halanaerobiales bacterium]HQD03210.1 stage V sporulation protein AC [Halanaerobiales bacterium]
MKNINKTTDEFNKIVKKEQPAVNKVSNFLKAYLVGGTICLIGQIFWELYMTLFDYSQQDAETMVTITMIFLGGLLTGLDVYDEIGQFAGAGSLVPVTGFANSMVAPALEYKQEGFIIGIGANLFSIAGPVLAYGMVSAFLVGLIKTLF